MFTLTEERRVEWPVKVHVAERGATRTEKFTAIFLLPSIDDAQEAIGDGSDPDRVRDFLSEVMVGWTDVVDSNGKAIECSAEVKARALNRFEVLEAVAQAFQEALRGGRRKN